MLLMTQVGPPKNIWVPGLEADTVVPQLAVSVGFQAAAVKGALCLVPTAALRKLRG